jgi:hypothetical protein
MTIDVELLGVQLVRDRLKAHARFTDRKRAQLT